MRRLLFDITLVVICATLAIKARQWQFVMAAVTASVLFGTSVARWASE